MKLYLYQKEIYICPGVESEDHSNKRSIHQWLQLTCKTAGSLHQTQIQEK